MKETWRVLPDLGALSRAAAEFVVSAATAAIQERQRFMLVLAGGSTPRALHEVLATECRGRIDWGRTFIFFGDERCVPPDHGHSNYLMAHASLLSRVPIPAGNITRMKGELGPGPGSEAYERALRGFFPASTRPEFDVVLLGMGADGHTLSLFPGRDVGLDLGKWVAPGRAPAGAPSPDRITLTLGAIEGAASAALMAAGKDKSDALVRVRESRKGGAGPPAALVRCRGELIWFVDQAAAGSTVGPPP